MFDRLTKWNGNRYVLPQGRTSDGKSFWRMIAERLAAYENLGSIDDIKAKLEHKPSAEDLSSEELERAYRIQEHNYFLMDARNHLDEYVEDGVIREEDITDDVLEDLVSFFQDRFDCNSPENIIWEYVIEKYLYPDNEDMRLMQTAYNVLVNGGKADLEELFRPVLTKNRIGRFYRLAKDAYKALQEQDVDEAIGFLGEIFDD